MITNIYLKKNILKTIPVLLFCTIIVWSCKKEIYQKEIIDLKRAKEIEGFKKDGKIQTITFDQFKSNVNSNGLGTLKNVLYNPKSSNNSKSTSATLPEINGYVINTSEIKVLEINGSTNYVFSVLPLRASAVTFRNVTIQEKNNTTTAVMTIYTPTKAWIQNNRKGKTQRFDGKVDVVPLDLNKTNILSMTASMELKAGGKINSLKTAPPKTTDAQYVCSSVNVWVPIAYPCASGMGHMPWDICEIEDPERRAGYRWEEQTQTTCAWIQTDPPPTGTGETTPNPPPSYDPCDTGLPEGNNPPVSTIDDTPCDVVDCAGVTGGTAYNNADCGTCMGGTTGITECPPEIINNVVDTCIKKTVATVLNNDVTGKISEIISNLDKNVNVKIKVYDAVTTTNGGSGETTSNAWLKDPNTGIVIGFSSKITLSKDILLTSSKEFTSMVLIHEILHAYFRETTAKKEAFDGLDHQTIASSYIQPMAEFISSLYGISLSDAMAISWDGVRSTKAFTDVSSFTIGSGSSAVTLSKQNVLDLIRDYTLKTNGKGKDLCL